MRQHNIEWLAQQGFEYTGYQMYFMPPNKLNYRHTDGRYASLEDTTEGYLEVDGKSPTSNREALTIFGSILSRSNYHL